MITDSDCGCDLIHTISRAASQRIRARHSIILAPITVRISPIAMMIAAQLMTWTVIMAFLAIRVLVTCMLMQKHFGGHDTNLTCPHPSELYRRTDHQSTDVSK